MKRLLLVAVAILAAGCGGGDDAGTSTTGHEGTPVVVYFLRDGQVWPVERQSHGDGAGADSAMSQLLVGPTEEESELGLTSEVPSEGITRTSIASVSVNVPCVGHVFSMTTPPSRSTICAGISPWCTATSSSTDCAPLRIR